jgi:hypothetical protein
MIKSEVWLQVGLNRREQLIHISESPRGDACDLLCPHCNGELTAKKGRKKVHHFAHQTNSCRPHIPRFDFWATDVGDTNLPLDLFFYQHQQQLQEEQTSLCQSLQQQTENWQRTKTLMAELLTTLADVSKAHRNGNRPANRQRNCEVLEAVQEFLESTSADRGPVPPLYKVRHSQFDYYWNLCLKPGRWGSEYVWGYGIYPGRLWQEELDKDAYIIPAALHEHYKGLVAYHRQFNELGDLSREYEAFERTRLRYATFNFYFLRIELPTGTLYKSGITSRPLHERIAEITRDLQPLNVLSIEPLAIVEQAGHLEAYFKRKYTTSRQSLSVKNGSLTEYFAFSTDELETICEALKSLSPQQPKLQILSRSERIRMGMRRVQQTGKSIGRPKASEQVDAFLSKPKSQRIVQLLNQGQALREIERQTGYSINTIRKVYQHVNQLDRHLLPT